MKRKVTYWILTGFALAHLPFDSTSFGQEPLTPRQVIAKPERFTVDPMKHDVERIYVKFRDDVPIRLRNERLIITEVSVPTLVMPSADAMSLTMSLINRLDVSGARWERLHSVSEEALGEMRRKAQRSSGRVMPDLNAAFILHVPAGMQPGQIINELNTLDSVEIARPMALPGPDPVVSNYEPDQGYLDPATGGVDATYAWTQPAGAGGNVWIADIESNWNLNHADFSATLIGPAPTLTDTKNIEHGTAVLGILAGRNDGLGVTGIAYNSTLFVAARTTAAGYRPADAITRAIAVLREGDIIVLEMQADGPAAMVDADGVATDLVPIEWDETVYQAVRMAVDNGIIVVAAAGNGNQNLDDPIYSSDHAPFLAENDSGAIIVGAGGSPGGSVGDRSRLGFSTFGARINLQGWGENVVTTGYGDLHSADGANSFYTSTFNGTSSATPIVAAACAVLQAHHKFTNSGAVLTPREMREILRVTGSPQLAGTNPVTQNIGPRPDLRRAMPYVSGPRRWVDFPFPMVGTGTFALPFNTLPVAILEIPEGGSIICKSGATRWTGTIAKKLTLKSFGGPVTFGL